MLTSTPLVHTPEGLKPTGSLNETSLAAYCRLFEKVTVVGRGESERLVQQKISEKLQFIAVDCRTIKGLRDFTSFIRKEKRKNGALVICARLPSLEGLLGLAMARRRFTVAEIVGDTRDAIRYKGNGPERYFAGAIDRITKWAVRRCGGARYVTSAYLQKRYPSHGLSFSCSDVQLGDFLSQPEATPHQVDGEWRLGIVGEIASNLKGIDIAIGATSILQSHGFPIRLRVAGRGDPERWRTLARSRGVFELVSFDGVVAHENLPKWFSQIDIYLQPSRQEGLPRALAEAMAMGLPCIGARTGGIPELLPDNALHASGDEFDLANKIKQLFVSSVDGKIGNANRAKVSIELSPTSLSTRFDEGWTCIRTLAMLQTG